MLSLRANRRRLSVEADSIRKTLLTKTHLSVEKKLCAPRTPPPAPPKHIERGPQRRRYTLCVENGLPDGYMRGGGGGMPLSVTTNNILHEDREPQSRKWPSENNNNNGQSNHVEVRGKTKKFTVSKADEPSDASGGCSDSGVSAARSTPPIIVIESVTGDKTLAAAEKASDSGNDSEDEGGGAGGPGSPTAPLLPRPSALRKNATSNFSSTVGTIYDEPDEEAIEAYKQRKRPSITFALTNDDDLEEDEDDVPLSPNVQAIRRGSLRSPICVNPIIEEEALSHSSENLVPMSVKHIERRRSNSNSSQAHSSVSSLASDYGLTYNAERRPSRQFTVINYGQACAAGLPQDVLARRASTQLTIPSVNLTDGHYSPRHSINSLSIPSDYNIKSSRLLKTLIADENRRNSMVCDGLPRVVTPPPMGYDRMNSHRSSVFTQTGHSIPRVAKRGWLYAQRRTQRLVNKQGDFNISYKNIRQKHVSYLVDLFTTVLDMKWRYTILIFVICFCTSWVVFALLWWFVAFIHGDHGNKDGPQKCVAEVYDFTTALLFSVETQHTIGYGVRAVTPDCPESILMLMLQSLFGVIVQCVMAGFVLAKLARPKYRAETIMFSKNAVIAQEDGEYCLLFRVGDMRRSQLVGAMLHAMFVKKRVTMEGDEIPFYQYHLEVSAESEDYDQFIFLSWPIRVIHRINRASPLWGVSADQLLIEDFEIIVVLEGVVEATGMTTQVRTSYLPSEILWGHRLKPLLTYRKDNGRYEIDYGRFHETLIDDDMPEESAQMRFEREHPEECNDRGSRSTLPPLARRSDSVSSYYIPAVTVPQPERVR